MMIRFNRFWKISTQSLKCVRLLNVTLLQNVQLIRRLQNETLQRDNAVKEDIIANLCKKLRCSEYSAKHIYKEFPTLRSIDAVKNDTLEMLENKLSAESIVENPSLVTMDISKKMQYLIKLTSIIVDVFICRNIDE